METAHKNWFRRNWLLVTLLILPFIIGAWFYNQLPDEIPSHWNAKGEVDDYAGKWVIFLTPIINVFVVGLISLLVRIDPKKNYKQFESSLERIMLFFTLFFIVIFAMILFSALGYQLNTTQVIYVAILFLFALIGNYLGKIRHNYFVGVRTPWTLESESVWNKTHRFTGKIWVFASAIMMVPAFILTSEQAIIALIIYVLIIVLAPTIYSYIVFKQESIE